MQGSNFATLAKAIVFQQLATGAAATIYGRVLAACGGGDTLSPAAALVASTDSLRAAGLSERKVSYIRDLAEHFADGRLSDAKIAGGWAGGRGRIIISWSRGWMEKMNRWR